MYFQVRCDVYLGLSDQEALELAQELNSINKIYTDLDVIDKALVVRKVYRFYAYMHQMDIPTKISLKDAIWLSLDLHKVVTKDIILCCQTFHFQHC